jgi:hypothetical protein
MHASARRYPTFVRPNLATKQGDRRVAADKLGEAASAQTAVGCRPPYSLEDNKEAGGQQGTVPAIDSKMSEQLPDRTT